jgi:ABC-type antimicrobial peptide transport system permease subunit
VINLEFFVILAVASVFGSWVGYTMCNLLMNSIWRYYQGVNIVTFVASVSLLMLISFLTVGYKIFNVASMNPVDSLKDE